MKLYAISQLACTPIRPLFKGSEKTPDCASCPQCPGCGGTDNASKTPPTIDNKNLEKDTFKKS